MYYLGLRKKDNLWLFYFIVVPVYLGLIIALFNIGNIVADLIAGFLIVLGIICLAGGATDLVVWLKRKKDVRAVRPKQ